MTDENPKKKTFLPAGWYDSLKQLAMIILPAVGTAYFGLAGIWGLPAADKVTGTIIVIDTFLGVLLGISSSQYNAVGDGDMIVTQDPKTGKILHSMEFDGDPAKIKDMDMVRFKVKNRTNESAT